MAAGIGEASAIISVVELGFSLATALNTYVSAVSAAPDEVSNLSSEIEATFLHLKGLEGLIAKNEETKGWDDDGLSLATKSIRDCEVIVKKLRRLLQKASWKGKEEEKETFVQTEIDLNKFERALWPRLRPELEVCKGELQRIKLNIILANSSYMIGTVSTEAEKTKYREAILGLNRAREWNDRKIKRMRNRRSKPPINNPGLFPTPGRGPGPHVFAKSPLPMPVPGYSALDDEMDAELQDDFDRFLELEEEKEIENERQFVLAQEAKKKQLEEEKKKKIEQNAIDEYVGKLKKAEVEAKKRRDELKRKLEERGGLTQPQIEQIIDDVHPRNKEIDALISISKDTEILDERPRSMMISDSHDGDNVSSRSVSRLSSFRKLLRSNSGTDEISANTTATTTLSSAWRDPATKTGFAKLESWYISAGENGRGSRQMQAPLPQSWMLKALMEAEKGSTKHSKRFPPVWEVLLSLSPQLVHQISSLLEERAAQKPNYDWSILLVDLPKTPENNRFVVFGPFKFYLQDKKEEVNEVYVILKYEETPLKQQSNRYGRQRSTSPESVSSENSGPQRRASTSLLPERSRSISRRRSSISRARSTLRPSYSGYPEEDTYEDRPQRRPSRRSSSHSYVEERPVYGQDSPYYPTNRPQPQVYVQNPEYRRPRAQSYYADQRVWPETAEAVDRDDYYAANPTPRSATHTVPNGPVYTHQTYLSPATRIHYAESPLPGVAPFTSYSGIPRMPPPPSPASYNPGAPDLSGRGRAGILRRDSVYDEGDVVIERRREPYLNQSFTSREDRSPDRRQSSMPRASSYYEDEEDYTGGVANDRVQIPIPGPIRRTNSISRERDGSEDSDSDDPEVRHRRLRRNREFRRTSREEEAQRHANTRRHSIAREFTATVTDENDEDELSEEKEIVDRLVAKHTRSLPKSAILGEERTSKVNGAGKDPKESARVSRLSDITEVDEVESSEGDNDNTGW